MEEHASLFDNHGAGILPFQAPGDPCFAAEGLGSTHAFLAGWTAVKAVDPDRLVIMSTADHDFDRLRCGPRTPEQLDAALAFLLSWGSVPCIYYGDEIGMRDLPGLPNVEGAICNPTYNRAGCRTPMQWDGSANAGFSTADASELYLPIDPDPTRPTVAAQDGDPVSTLSLVRSLIALRKATPALSAGASTRVLNADYPFAYLRGESHLVVVNPRREPASLVAAELSGAEPLLGNGVSFDGDTLTIDGFGYGIFARPDAAAAS